MITFPRKAQHWCLNHPYQHTDNLNKGCVCYSSLLKKSQAHLKPSPLHEPKVFRNMSVSRDVSGKVQGKSASEIKICLRNEEDVSKKIMGVT